MREHWIEEKEVAERVAKATANLVAERDLALKRSQSDYSALKVSQACERSTYAMLKEAMRWLVYGQAECERLRDSIGGMHSLAQSSPNETNYWRGQFNQLSARYQATLARADALEAQVQELRAKGEKSPYVQRLELDKASLTSTVDQMRQAACRYEELHQRDKGEKATLQARLDSVRSSAAETVTQLEQRLAAKDAELKRVAVAAAHRIVPGTPEGHEHLVLRFDDLAEKVQRLTREAEAREDLLRYLDDKVEEHEKALFEQDPDDGEADEEAELPQGTDRLDAIEHLANRALNLANRAHERLNAVDERLEELEEVT